MSNRSLSLVGSVVVIVALVAGLTLGSAPLAAKKETVAEFSGNVLALGFGSQPRTTIMNVRLHGWTTDEQRDELIQAVRDASEDKFPTRGVSRALRKQKSLGTIFVTGSRGYPLRFAREIESGGERWVYLATDRPVSFSEVYRGTQARDFDVTLIELRLPAEGSGDGVAAVGAEVIWNEQTEKLEITNFSTQPIRISDVRRAE